MSSPRYYARSLRRKVLKHARAKCPKCGRELEKGVMQLGGGGRGNDIVF